MLRLTAKSTQFGRQTFVSWIIEAAGTVPLMRKKDFEDANAVDNTKALAQLTKVYSNTHEQTCPFTNSIVY
jgi:glycerol-3-phosphate O-acyltransferase/dihydroxyacetone phosphate acyltransferase